MLAYKLHRTVNLQKNQTFANWNKPNIKPCQGRIRSDSLQWIERIVPV